MRIVTLVNAAPASAALGRLASVGAAPMASAPVRDAVVDAGRAYMSGQRDRFKSASGGDGTWAPLSAATIYKRLRAAGNAAKAVRRAQSDPRLAQAVAAALPVLYVTGQLYSSLSPGGPGNVERVLPDGVLVGTDDRTAAFHQYGTGRMPARPVLAAPSDDDRRRMRTLVAAGMRAATSAGG